MNLKSARTILQSVCSTSALVHLLCEPPRDAEFEVLINDAPVGRISSETQCAIRTGILRQSRLYFDQFINLGRALGRMADAFVTGVPILLFWGMIGLAIYAPEAYNTILAMLAKGPTAISVLAHNAALAALYFWAIFVGLHFLFGMRFGLRNLFLEEYRRQIRLSLGVAADGELSLRMIETHAMEEGEVNAGS